MSNIETKKEKKSILNKIGGDKLILIAAIIIVFALFTFLNKNFLTWANMVNLLVAASLVGLVAVGHTYLIIAGQNDLSPGSGSFLRNTGSIVTFKKCSVYSYNSCCFTCRCGNRFL